MQSDTSSEQSKSGTEQQQQGNTATVTRKCRTVIRKWCGVLPCLRFSGLQVHMDLSTPFETVCCVCAF